MPHPIEPSTLRILNAKGQTIGTGFLVSKTLAVTCAHVVLSAGMDGEKRIPVQFRNEKQPVFAKVLDEFFDLGLGHDVAILQLDEVPAGISPLRLGRASESRLKNDLYTFGYAIAAGEQGIGGLGTFIRQEDSKFIQFRMHEADHGHSGAPIYDSQRSVVIGMVKKGKDETGRNDETTFAIPSETIWQVCPQLKPPTPVLPRRNPIVEGINLLPYDYDQRIQNFLGEYLGSDQHPVPFGGRDDALYMLDKWLADTTPYLLLAAPAGRGKSALLVRWLDSLSSREDLALTFVPVSIRFGTNMERVFYAALAARLAFLHGDDVPASPETSTAVYRGLVSDYLSKPLANGRTLLVVLDGLDEAADWQAGADFMPSELPVGVRVVVSARFLAEDADSITWLRRLNWERNGLASTPTLGPLNQAGVADVLIKMGCPLEELGRNVDIVAELYRLSQGDPLLVSLYVGDLWTKGREIPRLKPEDLANIQPDYEGYFNRWWNDQEKLWGADTPLMRSNIQMLLNLLACALSRLNREDLVRLAPQELNRYTLDNALKTLQRFIIGGKKTQGYTFSHPKLSQYFWGALTSNEQMQVEERFLVWGELILQEFISGRRKANTKTDIPIYVVRNYATHLIRAGQPVEKLLPFIYQQQWAQVWFLVEGGYGGYLQDVQRVWEQCKLQDLQEIKSTGKTPCFAKQIRCAFIEASIHSLAESTPIGMITPLVISGVWKIPQAWAFIRQIPDDEQQSLAVIYNIQVLANEQHIPDILNFILRITDEQKRALALIELVDSLPKDQFNMFLEITRNIKNEAHRAEVLSNLPKRLTEEQLAFIFDMMWEIKDQNSFAKAFSKLIEYLPKEKLAIELNAANQIDDRILKKEVLHYFSQPHPDEKLAVAWEHAAMSRESEESRARVLSELTLRLPEDYLKVMRMAQIEIQNEEFRSRILSKLALRMPEKHLPLILEAASKMKEENRFIILIELIPRLPEIATEALKTARAIKYFAPRFNALCQLVAYIPELSEELLRIGRGKDFGRSNSENEYYDPMYAYNSANLSDEHIWITLAKCLPEKQLSQVLEAMQKMPDESFRVEVLSILAHRLPEKQLSQVLELTQKVPDESSRAKLLSILAHRLPTEQLAIVRKLAQKIVKRKERAVILISIAQRSPELANEILPSVQKIDDKSAPDIIVKALGAYLLEIRLIQILEILKKVGKSVFSGAVNLINFNSIRISIMLLFFLIFIILQMLTIAVLYPFIELPLKIKRILAGREERKRVERLSGLLQRLPEEQMIQMLGQVRGIQDAQERAHLLNTLLQRLPVGYLVQVFEQVSAIRDERERVQILSVLAYRLPERQLTQILNQVRAVQNIGERVRILSIVGQRLPKVAEEALKMVDDNREESSRIRVLENLSQYLPKEYLLRVLKMVPDVGYFLGMPESDESDYKDDYINLLSTLAQRLPEKQLEKISEVAKTMSLEYDLLIKLTQIMPDRQLPEVLEVTRAISNERERVEVLSHLANRLPNVISEALTAICMMQDQGLRVNLLSNLVQPLSNLSSEDRYLCLDESLSELSKRSRSNLFSDISVLMPVILRLGTDNTPREIYQAVRDVTVWWP